VPQDPSPPPQPGSPPPQLPPGAPPPSLVGEPPEAPPQTCPCVGAKQLALPPVAAPPGCPQLDGYIYMHLRLSYTYQGENGAPGETLADRAAQCDMMGCDCSALFFSSPPVAGTTNTWSWRVTLEKQHDLCLACKG
jgi:hypothetical protein